MAVTGPRAAYVLALALLVICSSGIADYPNRPGTAAAEPPAIRRADAIPQGRSARGIDVVFYGSGAQVEYDFEVAPGADPGAVKLAVSGADDLRVDGGGDLVLRVGEREIRQGRPIVYQRSAGERVPRDGHYVLRGSEVRFAVDAYDRSKPLVIDGTLLNPSQVPDENWLIAGPR
jgi:hypothetical protein